MCSKRAVGGTQSRFSSLPTAHCTLRTVFLLTAHRSLLTVLLLLLTAHCTLPTASAQFSQTQGNSPLYSSRPYQARAPSGLPKALNGVGIDQKLNEQLPLDLVFKDEKGA
ncbi:MAG TPA: hypothetical protein VGO68_01495, partial [Pyrinomonadaceae bacterium]|nr:hypothetical protein [Pyrinomonadaceae bacterium]